MGAQHYTLTEVVHKTCLKWELQPLIPLSASIRCWSPVAMLCLGNSASDADDRQSFWGSVICFARESPSS